MSDATDIQSIAPPSTPSSPNTIPPSSASTAKTRYSRRFNRNWLASPSSATESPASSFQPSPILSSPRSPSRTANAMTTMDGAGSPMMADINPIQLGGGVARNDYQDMHSDIYSWPSGPVAKTNYALQDYQMMALLLEQRNKSRTLMAQAESYNVLSLQEMGNTAISQFSVNHQQANMAYDHPYHVSPAFSDAPSTISPEIGGEARHRTPIGVNPSPHMQMGLRSSTLTTLISVNLSPDMQMGLRSGTLTTTPTQPTIQETPCDTVDPRMIMNEPLDPKPTKTQRYHSKQSVKRFFRKRRGSGIQRTQNTNVMK
jgi:hypothetical protein